MKWNKKGLKRNKFKMTTSTQLIEAWANLQPKVPLSFILAQKKASRK